MKKLIALLLCIALAFSFAACSKNGKNAAEADTKLTTLEANPADELPPEGQTTNDVTNALLKTLAGKMSVEDFNKTYAYPADVIALCKETNRDKRTSEYAVVKFLATQCCTLEDFKADNYTKKDVIDLDGMLTDQRLLSYVELSDDEESGITAEEVNAMLGALNEALQGAGAEYKITDVEERAVTYVLNGENDTFSVLYAVTDAGIYFLAFIDE